MTSPPLRLYSYFQSSAAWRVRIALELKGVAHDIIPINLLAGEQRADDYAARNPSRLVPALEVGDVTLTQSLAIIEYLDERYPEPPLLPADSLRRAQVRSFAQHIACEVHPLNNLRVRKYLKTRLGQDDAFVRGEWYAHWITEAFGALEAMAEGPDYCFGDAVSLADIVLVPQVANARRFNVDLDPYPKLRGIAEHLETLPAFRAAQPDRAPQVKP
jgi:maleylacetoacetate isomerase